MSVKGKLLRKAATKIKKKIGSMNSTDNMSSKGPIDNAIELAPKPKNMGGVSSTSKGNYVQGHTWPGLGKVSEGNKKVFSKMDRDNFNRKRFNETGKLPKGYKLDSDDPFGGWMKIKKGK